MQATALYYLQSSCLNKACKKNTHYLRMALLAVMYILLSILSWMLQTDFSKYQASLTINVTNITYASLTGG
ncbi:MAG TPA: hypothetical protein VLN09_06920 [Psychrobacter sp.]|uniref:hypothetical protein n=1 Tax=Psychrobacter sp. TaxID=56811 RepID=UPI002B9E8FD1|nr:hypothetical protein [Psychrobacter sp.]HSP85459.1 hypothetical protein [Psychrobacter sp.]